jgi:hypothetical protein
VVARNWWRKLEVRYEDRLRCFRKHKLKDPKGKEEEEENKVKVTL